MNENELSQTDTKLQLRQDKEVMKLAQLIDTRDQISLLEYGKEPANEISTFSGRILNTIKSNSVEESSVLFTQLGKIMDKFDSKDFAEEEKGFFAKMFNRGEKLMEKLFAKYQTMGGEIDKVYVEIKKYETEMKNSTQTLEQLYEQNFQYYMDLEKYIVAGEMKAEELRTKLPELEERAMNNQLASLELTTLTDAIELLEQRVYDLEMAKQVAYQSAPQIRLLQRGNTKLIAKINSAFVTTIPIFKTGLINAIAAKRQNLVAKSMEELDKRTNEMLLKNAQNITNQSAHIARLAGSPSIKIETMEQTWAIIMKGMEETKAIEEENKKIREEGKLRLEQLQENFKKIK